MTRSEQREWSLTFQRFQASRTRFWQPKLFKVLKEIIRNSLNEESIQAAISRVDTNIRLDKLFTIIQNIYIDAGKVFGGKTYQLIRRQTRKNVGAELATKAMVPMGFNEEMINEIILYLRIHNIRMAIEITETMRDWIIRQLVELQQQGKSITQAVDEIQKKESFPRNRAFTIARTETGKSANAAAMIAARKSGYKMTKTWLSSHDHRVRRLPKDEFSHVAMDGVTLPLEQRFHVPNRNGGVDLLMHPLDPEGDVGNVVNCRCCLTFTVLKDANRIPIRN